MRIRRHLKSIEERREIRVAAAVVGGALIGAGGSYLASQKSSDATTSSTNAAITQQQQGLQQQAQLSAPYRALGESAIPTLQNLLGLGGGASGGLPPGASVDPSRIPGRGPGGANPDILETLRNTPGYQFARDEGLKSTLNSATATGMGLSGNTLEALDRYSTGLADQTYQQTVGNLENVVGMGQAAAAGQSANIGNAATNTSNLIMNQGNTLAGIQANEIAGITKAVGGGVNNYLTLQALEA